MIRFPFRVTRRRRLGALIALAAFLPAACGGVPELPDPGPPATSVLPSPVAPGQPTARPRPEPLAILDVRPRRERAPVPDVAAPCGRVDRMDFPMGPPDAIGYDARWSYGRMSRRYGKYHAGEDWLSLSGSSLGLPVYSVGHGRVEYAEPYGWGQTDKGVVILRHVFDDGSTVLSFYGHLEPASIGLEPGACIQRGEPVGRVGKPRGRPHLHFEIRDHMAGQPGPGYWPSDPDLAGWHPPSEYIWQRRLDTLPDLHWRRVLTTTTQVMPLRLPDGAVVLAEGKNLSAIEPVDGSQRWRTELDSLPFDLALDAAGNRIYWSSRLGRVEALALGSPDQAPVVEWTASAAQAAHLMPLPQGGLAFHDGRGLTGLSADGKRIWHRDSDRLPRHHVVDGQRLLFTSEPPRGSQQPALPSPGAWTFELDPASGRLTELSTAWGRPLVIGELVFLHHASGVYRVDPAMARARGPLAATRQVLDLPVALLEVGSSLVLPEGRGLVISHRGSRSSSLVMLDAEGRLLWERDATRLQALARPAQLLLHGGSLLASTERGEVFEIDPASGDAHWIFDPGRLPRLPGQGIVLGAESGPLLMDFRGGELMAWDPPAERPELRAH